MRSGLWTIGPEEFQEGMGPTGRFVGKRYSPKSIGVDIERVLGGVTPGYLATDDPLGDASSAGVVTWGVPGGGTAVSDNEYLYCVSTTHKIWRIRQADGNIQLIRTLANPPKLSTGSGAA